MNLLTVRNMVILIFIAVILGFLSRIYPFLRWISLLLVIIVTIAFLILRNKIYKKIESQHKHL
ncbi:hypothetical protein HON71_01895 [Candidatus Woesearchaeota archaeon]|nr:hypothetical protein [Candidatus Woesearchaeota archaeon]MBT5342269.1 hypothetical protein [Candidatus Woesearchaeota archaeon]